MPDEPKSPPLFGVPAEHYDRFMGRYTPALAAALADAAGVRPGMRVLDVGCGPGGLTGELAGRLGAGQVAAIDPAPQFAAACRDRHPGADVRTGAAEQLPWPDARFDAALACLVVAFMRDPDLGLREMARVTRPGGTVAACMWDTVTGGMTMLEIFWTAAGQAQAGAPGEADLPGTSEGDLVSRLVRAGLRDVTGGVLVSQARYTGFEDFWEPFTLAVGPAGHYLRTLSPGRQAAIRDACRPRLPDGPFTLPARAWYARGVVPALPGLLAAPDTGQRAQARTLPSCSATPRWPPVSSGPRRG
jgi:ubiquinone/menaquinone biosynthesis C-methylase UbiE